MTGRVGRSEARYNLFCMSAAARPLPRSRSVAEIALRNIRSLHLRRSVPPLADTDEDPKALHIANPRSITWHRPGNSASRRSGRKKSELHYPRKVSSEYRSRRIPFAAASRDEVLTDDGHRTEGSFLYFSTRSWSSGSDPWRTSSDRGSVTRNERGRFIKGLFGLLQGTSRKDVHHLGVGPVVH